MKAIEEAPEDVQQAMRNIMHCITAEDAGISLVNFLNLINSISNQLNDSNQKDSARKLLDVIVQFSRIIDYAQKK